MKNSNISAAEMTSDLDVTIADLAMKAGWILVGWSVFLTAALVMPLM